MTPRQFEKKLRKEHGIESNPKRGTGHRELFNPKNGRRSQIPMHGGGKQLGTGLMNKILKDLGLK
jgi:mRNA interferase HicA